MSVQIPWSSHRVLLRETVLEGFLVNDSPIRVGAGRESPLGSIVDLAVVRISIGGKVTPYIPGSSLKGIFRSTSELIARTKGINVCSGLSKNTCMDRRYPEGHSEERLHEAVQRLLRERRTEEAINKFHKYTCLLCKIYGAPLFTGHVEFSDAYPIRDDGTILEVPIGSKTGIAINRRTGAVWKRALYQVEFIEPNARFHFQMRTSNLPNYALGLLARVMRMIQEGEVKIGGFKTRGFGKVRFEDLVLKHRDLPEQTGKILRALDEHDFSIDFTNVAEIKDGWLFVKERIWDALRNLEGAWDRATLH
jgi:CRISPR-associated protein Csm3